jgi:hypothetical protein
MNETLKAVIIEVTGGNVRNHHINLRGVFGLFPDDTFGGANQASAGAILELRIGSEIVETDIDETKAIFRERGAIRRFLKPKASLKGIWSSFNE